MFELRKTETYSKWLDGVSDIYARARVQVRVERLAAGNPGDVKPVGEGVSELRINYGPGYRVYFTMRERTILILLPEATNAPRLSILKLRYALHVTYRSKL